MTIFINTLKRIFRNKVQIFFILLFPLAFMSLGFIGQEQTVRVAVIDHDHTKFTADLVRNLKTKAEIRDVKAADINNELKTLKVDYVVEIDKGFSNNLIQGKTGGITGYSVKESNFSKPVSASIEQWLQHAMLVAESVGHNPDSFYKEFSNYDQHGAIQLEHKLAVNEGAERTRSVLGYLIISMLYTSLIVGLFIIFNKNNHTLYRTLTAPVKIKTYMLQIVSSFLFVSFIQISFVLLILKFVYKLYLGSAGFSIFILLLLFSLVTVSFGVAISSISKNIIQACLIGICLVAPLAMLGGAYFPLEFAPDIIKSLSNFTPVSWVITGIENLLHGQSLFSLGKEVLVLIVFSLIFFLLGTFRKADIAK
ncbi:ABC-2 type transporter [Neobacillus bataviensis LMG 21833]|uniref:ABC-2 type transporter n=1 Tax=Neobacillus bataviensis LMG 21833 TaxID=1117379 RepID=K6DGL0_9BACI|nr:ABC transporter permease [Neobacillus bataviensis]EKN71707.1 ABC-2 type transporter [Neobacillus bataviensis LMG 21833]